MAERHFEARREAVRFADRAATGPHEGRVAMSPMAIHTVALIMVALITVVTMVVLTTAAITARIMGEEPLRLEP